MVSITVRYRLREYCSLLSKYLVLAEAAKKSGESIFTVQTPARSASILERSLVCPIATLGFLYKKARVGDCAFVIDESGIKRTAKGKEVAVPWNSVKRVFRFDDAFLIAKESGAMPIPYRCLSDIQRSTLENIFSAVGHGIR